MWWPAVQHVLSDRQLTAVQYRETVRKISSVWNSIRLAVGRDPAIGSSVESIGEPLLASRGNIREQKRYIHHFRCVLANPHKSDLLSQLATRYGQVRKLEGSASLFEFAGSVRIYVRYSKLHPMGRTFFGLRTLDLRQLEGHTSFLCFIVDDGSPPLFIPYSDFEEVFHEAVPAADGQYKVQLLNGNGGMELYIARQGRFSVEPYRGFKVLETSIHGATDPAPNLTHSQVQTLLAGIGRIKGYDIWVPPYDCAKLDWPLTQPFRPRLNPPTVSPKVSSIVTEIDVVWIAAGVDSIEALFEVEHSTSIYSGLLRFNDLLLTDPKLNRFSVVSNESRRACFSRQALRPTFQRSGLSKLVSFLEYSNVYEWHRLLTR